MKQVFTPKKMRPSAQTIYLLHQADSLLLSYHGAKWEAKGVLS